MKEAVFREASMDRLKSPEQLDDYIRVVRPGAWLLAAAAILLLAGAVVWGAASGAEASQPNSGAQAAIETIEVNQDA